MKTKQLLLNIFSALFFAANLNAADLCVNESGTGGCYTSITNALAAANDGDRILIQPKTGNVPYVEALTINKSVQLLSNQEGVMWGLTGNITITPAIGRNVTIMHMRNTTGNISASANSPVGVRCKVNIMNCALMDGNINFDVNYFNVSVISNVLSDGYIAIRYGNIIGNDVKLSVRAKGYMGNYVDLIYVGTDAVSTNDTINIIGNRLESADYYYVSLIEWNSPSQFFSIYNNYGYHSNTGGTAWGWAGVLLSAVKNSNIGVNKIINNTFYSKGTFNGSYSSGTLYGFAGIYHNVASVPNFQLEILNNLILTNGAIAQGIFNRLSSGVISCSYNFLNNNSTIVNIVNNGTNNLTSNTTINTTTGAPNTGSDVINGGYPDLTFYDTDLTINDVGAYGGSFTLNNFFPITGAARVYFIKAPRTVLQSGTLNIKANSFDR